MCVSSIVKMLRMYYLIESSQGRSTVGASTLSILNQDKILYPKSCRIQPRQPDSRAQRRGPLEKQCKLNIIELSDFEIRSKKQKIAIVRRTKLEHKNARTWVYHLGRFHIPKRNQEGGMN